jgi:hypothetical protein
LPASQPDGTAVEWDFFVDADGNGPTGWLVHDTGAEYMVRLMLKGSKAEGELYNVSTGKSSGIYSKVTGDTLELSFTWTMMESLEAFDCVAVARKWTGDKLISRDDAPDRGHLNPAFSADSDGDSVCDYAETGVYGTSPQKAENWGDFNTVTSILNTPAKVRYYIRENFTYDWEAYLADPGGTSKQWKTAEETFRDRKSTCNGHAQFALYCLLKNGYKPDILNASNDKTACCVVVPAAHIWCMYVDNGKYYALNTTFMSEPPEPDTYTYVLLGPFNTARDMVGFIMRQGWQEYWLVDIDGHIIAKFTRQPD